MDGTTYGGASTDRAQRHLERLAGCLVDAEQKCRVADSEQEPAAKRLPDAEQVRQP